MVITGAIYGQFSSDAFETLPDLSAVQYQCLNFFEGLQGNRNWWWFFTWRLDSLLVHFMSLFLLLPYYRNSFLAQFFNLALHPSQWQEEGETAAEPGCLPTSVSASHNHWNICRTNMIVTHCPEGCRWYTGASGKQGLSGISLVGETETCL